MCIQLKLGLLVKRIFYDEQCKSLPLRLRVSLNGFINGHLVYQVDSKHHYKTWDQVESSCVRISFKKKRRKSDISRSTWGLFVKRFLKYAGGDVRLLPSGPNRHWWTWFLKLLILNFSQFPTLYGAFRSRKYSRNWTLVGNESFAS